MGPAGSDRVATVTRGRWATGSTTDAWARARGEGSEARATHGVGLAGLARLAVGRRGASRGMLLCACAELQGPGVRRGERRARALAGRGSRAVRALAERGGGMGRARKGNGPWGKDGLGCFGFGSSFHFYFFFFCKLTQTSLNSNKFEFKLPSTQPK